MRAPTLLVVALGALAACPKGTDNQHTIEPAAKRDAGGRQLLPLPADATATGSASAITLPPAPPLPEVPLGLPPVPAGVMDQVTPEAVALGEALFWDPRLSAKSPPRPCSSCHDPANRFIGRREASPKGDQLAHVPQLENLAWNPAALAKLPAHVAAVDGQDLATIAAHLATIPGYQAHLARVGGTAVSQPAIAAAVIGRGLAAFVLTRYDGNSPWDRLERTPAPPKTDPIVAGYKVFAGKGGCAVCHTPPLYTDLREHATGRAKPSVTPSLRSVAERRDFFTDNVTPLEATLDYYAADHPGSELKKVTLTAQERTNLLAFLHALSGEVPTAIMPSLP
jgi:cytochrome c peroxidase